MMKRIFKQDINFSKQNMMKVEIEQEKHLTKKLSVNYKVKSKVLSHGCNGSTDL